MQTIIIGIDGMTCGGFVASVTRVLKAVPGVDDVAVTLAPAQARVSFDPVTVKVEQLNSVIEEAGYAVAP